MLAKGSCLGSTAWSLPSSTLSFLDGVGFRAV